MEHLLPRPLQPAAPADPLTPDGPSAAARDAARAGLYVHVPFCAVRCTYCHFATAPLAGGATARWLAAIEREAERAAPGADGTTFTSVFLGGGTPSVLAPAEVTRLFAALRAHFALAPDAEVTLEANPESVRPARLDAWLAAGVNRLSLGAQSFAPGDLALLGRVHDAARPVDALALARAHGFARLSLDLMYGYPGHEPATFAASLDAALATGIGHLSAYAFIPDRGNPLGEDVLDGRLAVADDDAQAVMYETLLARAAAAGLAPYETSNVARPGEEARHNLTYWLRRDHVGLGPSAVGLWRGERRTNLRDTGAWAAALEAGEDPAAEREAPDAAETAEEAVMLALRLATGIRLADYPAALADGIARRFGEALEGAVAAGRLERTADGWRVPPARRFVADDAIAWVAARGRA